MRFAYSYVLSFLFLECLSSSNPDDYFPTYLRGIRWKTVQDQMKEDLSLSEDVVPYNYVIDLYVNAFLIESLALRKPASVTLISTIFNRETITVHANRTIEANEKFMLQITYRGTAKMDENGLYESWDPKFNKSLDSNGPFILASKNFPTGSRTWFPCIDEARKRATFELHINHPTGLNVYSNTNIERQEHIGEGRTLSVFEKTRLIPTYQVALSVNHLSVQSLDVKGFGQIRLIKSDNSHDYWSNGGQWYSHSGANDIAILLKHHLQMLSKFGFGEIQKEKLDIIILEGTSSVTVQPGLVTIGRGKLWKEGQIAQDFNFLNQLLIGNRISVKSTSHIWLTEMFSHFTMNETAVLCSDDIKREDENCISTKTIHPQESWLRNRYAQKMDIRDYDAKTLGLLLESSLHERPLRYQNVYATSTTQFLSSKQDLRSLKAAQLFQLLFRFCPTSKQSLQKYISDNLDRTADIDDINHEITKSCADSEVANEFLLDFIDKPGRAFLTVKRSNDSVTIQQTRYHQSYFDEILKDTKTRYTIPIFYTINNQPFVALFRKNDSSLEISVPQKSTFFIDHNYDHLYLTFYEDVIVIPHNLTKIEREYTVLGLQKGMLAATSIGFVKYVRIHEQMQHYVEQRFFAKNDYLSVWLKSHEIKLILAPTESEYEDNYDRVLLRVFDCKDWNGTDWSGALMNDTKYWQNPTFNRELIEHLHCVEEWANSTTYQRFLEENFLGEITVIRADLTYELAHRVRGYQQWRDLHRFFFRNAANYTNHRFDLLADTVLNRARITSSLLDQYYPDTSIRDDYVKELRDFVIRSPRRAASMANEIEMRLERQFIRRELPKWHNESRRKFDSYDIDIPWS